MAAGEFRLAQKRICAVDWSDLLPEMVSFISGYLNNTWDYIRFRAVCSSWRSAADRPPQTPCLLLPYDIDDTSRSFLDPTDHRITKMDIPEARWKCIYGTPHGWLVMVGQQVTDAEEPAMVGEQVANAEGTMFEVLLHNLITRAQILLPLLKVNINNTLPRHQILVYVKPVLTANPASSSGEKVFLALLVFNKLVIFTLGGETWNLFELSVPNYSHLVVMDCSYFDGAFYVVDSNKGTTVVSTSSLNKQYSPPSVDWICDGNRLHLVESSGDLLLLERNLSQHNSKVYKLDTSHKELDWVSIDVSIGDRTLFLSRNRSSLSISSTDFFRCGRDLICFAGYLDINESEVRTTYTNYICISDIKAGSSNMSQQPYYWQGLEEACKNKDNILAGLIWIKASLC